VASPEGGIALPGRNCWHVERADRFLCVQDAADYFRRVRQAILAARRSVFILGWDLQAIDLVPPDQAGDEAPVRLDALLSQVARRRRGLRCYVLIWDYDALYTLERDPFLRWRMGWRTPRRVRFGFDDRHPLGGCHHQKIVVVDDAVAFCGSVDLTTHRFDSCEHRCDDPLRTTASGAPYGPYHEVASMVSGPAAARLGALARDRWHASQGDGGKVPPIAAPEGIAAGGPDRAGGADPWPRDADPDLRDVEVAIARTLPEFESLPAVRECETLLLDAIGAAKRALYIESQYFTSDVLGQALAARLREPDGPEVLVVVPRECHGWLERNTMGDFREGVFRRMAEADRHGRLRLLYPMASRRREVPTFVHSKVLIADDVLLRIGSANFARRSMGLDSECDLAVDASHDAEARDGIGRIRDRLLGEHLGLRAAEVAAGVTRAGSLRAFVDARAGADRTLVRIDPAALKEPQVPEAIRAAADPDGPVGLDTMLDGKPAPAGTRSGRTAAALMAALSLFPVELIAVLAGLLLGARRGILAAFAGALLAAALGYAAGRRLGAGRLSRFMTRRAARSLRQVGAHDARGVAALRLASIAGGGAVNLFCGARRVRFASYLLGTALALLPQVTALGGLGALLRQTVLQPSPGRRLATLATVLILVTGAAALRSILLRRRFGRTVEEHRSQAEFG
jgi:phospholipase D1/2